MLTRWLDVWRQEPFRIATSLPADAAGARIRDALAELPRALRNPWLRVHQRSSGTDLTFRASTPRNGWAAVVRARFVPTGAGCEVVGSYGWPLWIRLFSGAWLGGHLLIWGGMLQDVATGAPHDGPVVVFVVGPPLMAARPGRRPPGHGDVGLRRRLPRRPFGSIAEQQRHERRRRQGRVLCAVLTLLGAAHLALYLLT